MTGDRQLTIEKIIFSILTLILWGGWFYFLFGVSEEWEITKWIKVPVMVTACCAPLFIGSHFFEKWWIPHWDRLEAKDRESDKSLK